jgi:hypothetical protein
MIVLSAPFDVKIWMDFYPCSLGINRVRPARCPKCNAASRPIGKPFVIVGHGMRSRHFVVMTHGEPVEIKIRRFRCRSCGVTITVLPSDAVPGRHYTRPVIVYALALWGSTTAVEVRHQVAVISSEDASWPQLRVWARASWPELGPLPRGPPQLRAKTITQAFAGRVSIGLEPIDLIEAAVEGARNLRGFARQL